MLFVRGYNCLRHPKYTIGFRPDSDEEDIERSDSESDSDFDSEPDSDSSDIDEAASGLGDSTSVNNTSDYDDAASDDTPSEIESSSSSNPHNIDVPNLDLALRRDPFRQYDKSRITVLDRLWDGGSHLKKLGLCLDFETQ